MSLILSQNAISLALHDVRIRIQAQCERVTPPLFTFDRNGLRMAIASLEDEVGELYEEWRNHKRMLGNAHKEIQHELLDISSVAMITYVQTL